MSEDVIEYQQNLPAVEAPSVSTPAQLLQVAIDKGADLDKLEQLMDMQIKWEANEARKAYVLAMSKFRAEVPTIERNAPSHNGKFASLDKITSVVNPLLAKHGLSFAWVTEQTNELITVHCDVTHEQGHSTRVSLTSGPETSGSKNAIQAIGSTVSYLQRYTLNAALGIATGQPDTNGNPVAEAVFISEEQALEVDSYIEDHGLNREVFMDWLSKSSKGQVTEIAEIKSTEYERVMSKLRKAKNADS